MQTKGGSVVNTRYMDTPAGAMILCAEQGALVRAEFVEVKGENVQGDDPVLLEAQRQLEEYFAGGRRMFSLPVTLCGTPFQMRVWEEMSKIPYGQTASYGQIAGRIGKIGAARAVGMACNKNPLCILYPCHRVVGAKGQLVGYASGVDRKEFLLELEQKTV